MEIVKRGCPPAERKYQGTCHNCGTIIRFRQHEAKYTPDHRDGDFLTMGCPVCESQIHVNASRNLPEPEDS